MSDEKWLKFYGIISVAGEMGLSMKYLYAYLLFVNIVTFGMCFGDKKAAQQNRYRVPERRLFTLAVIGGALGLYISMQLFRHKTRHLLFAVGVPVVIALQVVLLVILLF